MRGSFVTRGWPTLRSFYWRIAISFVVLVIAVLVTQAAMFGLILARSNVSAPPLYVVMADGEVLSSRQEHIETGTRQLLGDAVKGHPGQFPIAPLYAGGSLRGTVVLPPRPPRSFMLAVVRLGVPGTVGLALATVVAAIILLRPARRRLRELETAAERLGRGDLAARALEEGGDEIARVASAFNRMAAELERRDESLRTVDLQRKQMLADVSHELKTPLTAMRGYVESLRIAGDTLEPVTRDRYLMTLERETLRLDRIVRDLLELGRLEDHAMRFETRIFAIERVFERVVARHDMEAAARQVSFRTRVGNSADQMLGDPDRIEQVVENAVANALRHTPTGGTIELNATAEGNAIQLSIVDSGEGIPAEHLPHIFERFYKVDTSRTGSSGSGLGLSIAKAIVEGHRGRISVVTRPGRTAFIFAFPQEGEAAGALTG